MIKINNKQIGMRGEEIVANYLVGNDYYLLERNFRCRIGEIDIIAFDKEEKKIVSIEVKTRRSIKYGLPREAVDKRKQKHIISATKYYLLIKKLMNYQIRFDVIEVYLIGDIYKINHIKNCDFKA